MTKAREFTSNESLNMWKQFLIREGFSIDIEKLTHDFTNEFMVDSYLIYDKSRYDRLHDGGIHTWLPLDDFVSVMVMYEPNHIILI